MSTPDYTILQIDRLVKGMEIIRKYETDPYPCAAEHDVLYCGAFETRKRMTKEERVLMDTYGWHEDNEAWAFYT